MTNLYLFFHPWPWASLGKGFHLRRPHHCRRCQWSTFCTLDIQPFLHFSSFSKATVSHFLPICLNHLNCFFSPSLAFQKSKREDPCSRVGVFQACSIRPPFCNFSSPPVLLLSLPWRSFSTLRAKYLSLGYKYKSRSFFWMGVSNFVVEKSVNTHTQKNIVADHAHVDGVQLRKWHDKQQKVKKENHSREYDSSFFFKYYTYFNSEAQKPHISCILRK